jgi:hypothetical protein
MIAVPQIRMWLVAGVLTGLTVCAVPAGAAAETAPAFTPLTHSAQLILETASTPAELTLRLERTQGTTPLAVTDLTVAIDGRSAQVTRGADDTWSVAWPSGAARHGQLEVVVTHDGIHEVLSGPLPGAAAGPAGGSAGTGGGSAGTGGAAGAGHTGGLRDHKQLAWWILNIVVVLIAAIAISRRTS